MFDTDTVCPTEPANRADLADLPFVARSRLLCARANLPASLARARKDLWRMEAAGLLEQAGIKPRHFPNWDDLRDLPAAG